MSQSLKQGLGSIDSNSIQRPIRDNPHVESINRASSSGGEKTRSGPPAVPDGQSNWTFAHPSASQPHPSPGSQSSNSLADPTFSQHHSSPMIGAPPPMFYDPDQALAQESGDSGAYQQWVESYAQGGQQFTYTQPTISADVAALQYQQQIHMQQHGSMLMPDVPTDMMQQQPQNQYNFVEEQFLPPPSYDHPPLVQNPQGGRPQRALPNRGVRRQVETGAPVQYPAAPHLQMPQRSPPLAVPDTVQTSFQQHQPYSLHQAPATNEPYFYPPEIQAHPPDPLPRQEYNFSAYQPNLEQGPGSSYTPTSDVSNLSSSPSAQQAHWGTDDGQGFQYASGPSNHQDAQMSNAARAQGHSPLSPHSLSRSGSRRVQDKSAKGKGKSRGKRARTDVVVESDSQSDDDDLGAMTVNVSMPPATGHENMPTRLPGACRHCKKLKMKCDFPKGENTCRRCKTSGQQCVVEGRKPRNAPNKREYLLAQIRQKDVIIEKLLRELHNPYTATPLSIASYRMATSPSDRNNRDVIAWLDRLEASVQRAGESGGSKAFKFESRAGNDNGDGEDSDGEPEGAGFNDGTERGSVQQFDTDDQLKDADDKLQALPDATVPLGLLASLSLSNTKKSRKKSPTEKGNAESSDEDNVGVANETYFMPGPAFDLGIRASLIQNHSAPEILVHGLVTPEDVEKLFDIFYTRLNVHVTLLDREIHTPDSTFARCPFLFTVVCAIASRYYQPKSEIYPIAMHFARRAAADSLLNGWKSVELSQAYILLSIYAVPARRWEEDRSWLYTGLAIRIATDLNLHHVSTIQPKSERQRREILNQSRLWLICHNLDRSMATQFGKPSTIKEDYIIRNSENWYKQSPCNHPYDLGLCAYTALLRVMTRFHDEIYSDPTSPTGLNRELDFRAVTLAYDEDITRYFEEWTRRFSEDTDLQDPACAFRASLLPFLTNYSRLVMYSFGFQQAFRRGIQPEDQLLLDKCLQSARSVILCMVDTLCPSSYMRYSPDGHFIFASFASAFLLKLMRPEFKNLITKDQETEIFDLIRRLIQTLGSPEIAIDDRHTPKLHARFLAGLLARHRRDIATSGRIHPQHPPPSQMPLGPTSSAYSTQSAPTPSSSSSPQQVFPPAPAQGGFQDDHDMISNQMNVGGMVGEPVYQEEAAYAAGTGPLETFNFGATGGSGFEETLGALMALQSPAYWRDMMMPGYSWPESPEANGMHTSYNPGFDGYQTAEVGLHT
ncbi:hypothetical protein AcV7_005968 [Taiwanofungus camphoratus]|nr:hypothetical protein AcV7_005968 [Antrodia cinnamomea]